jgi:glycine/D-amino acid oxidase-like deaminating enzyme
LNLTSENLRFDVAIIGGGVMGCSTAHFIKSMAPESAVAVVEPDPTYEYASTLRASGGCRVQFSRPENIEMSRRPFRERGGCMVRRSGGDGRDESAGLADEAVRALLHCGFADGAVAVREGLGPYGIPL